MLNENEAIEMGDVLMAAREESMDVPEHWIGQTSEFLREKRQMMKDVRVMRQKGT